MKHYSDLLSADELTFHVEGCARNNRESQKIIYGSFYGYAMAICDRYTSKQEDAVEILNDGFLKIFKEIHHYQPAYADVISSFKGWLRKIMVYTAIDHFRKNQK
ncbi:MAG: sigma factor, partial [Bacteroidota bacterium]